MTVTRDQILSRTKAQYEPGPMRPRLVEVFRKAGKPLENDELNWLFYAGMGDCGLTEASAGEAKIVQALKDEGYLVPTWEDSIYGLDHYRELTHFDDVKWGRNENGEIIIYNFVHLLDHPEHPDAVLVPGERQKAALKELEHRTKYNKTMEDAPFTLKGYGKVTPILTNEAQINLRKRQIAFTPYII